MVFAREEASLTPSAPSVSSGPSGPSGPSPVSSIELVRQAWEASSQGNAQKLEELVNQCIDLYDQKAREQQSQLTGFPASGQEDKYQALNDVATCLFIRAEALMNASKKDEAILRFQEIIDEYSWARAWDPRGWYWSVAEKSEDSIRVLTGQVQAEDLAVHKAVRTKPSIHVPGTSKIVDYKKYGKFYGVGTASYHYEIVDMEGLSRAIGEGIYPNLTAIFKNPRYQEVRKEGRLKGKHWDFVNSEDLEAAYFKWVTAPEPWGVRLFYLGAIFEKAGMYYEALRAYHALVVHFPNTSAWTYWQTPWYPGQAAIAKIRYLLRIHPELNLMDKNIKIAIENGFDNDIQNDIIRTYPGEITRKSLFQKIRKGLGLGEKVGLGNPRRRIGRGKVQLVQYRNGHWQLFADGRPYIIQGITYAPTKVGQSPDQGTMANWMEEDTNGNGRADGPYDAWVDKNRNNIQDPDEPVVGDFALMKQMGVNTLRLYYHPHKPDKSFLRKMHKEYGFRVMMGNFLGKYAIGSGATWAEGTDYENPEHRKNMLESVQKMVMEFKDEPYILLWVLGNENNYGVASNADKKPQAYFQFVNEVAQWIKSVDRDHPVAVNNGDTLFLDIFARHAPEVDIFSANVYRGNYGFGSFWEDISDVSEKPVFITEYGCPAYGPHLTLEEAEEAQAAYLRDNWADIAENTAGHVRGIGNALGGVVFEWTDEWWKNYEPKRHDHKADAIGPFPGGYYFEEWFGVTSQGDGQHSPFLRQLRKVYFVYKELWNKKI